MKSGIYMDQHNKILLVSRMLRKATKNIDNMVIIHCKNKSYISLAAILKKQKLIYIGRF